MKETLLECRDLVKHYPQGKQIARALQGVSLALKEEDFLCVMGRSGSGKTTLLNCLGTLDRPTSGEIFFRGRETKNLSEAELFRWRKEWIGFIFQESYLFPYLSALDNAAVTLVYRGENWKSAREKALPILESMGLASRFRQSARWLSAGEAQRVSIARSLIFQPRILLADEPTALLDTATAKEILEILLRQKEKGTALLIATHDPAVAERADRIVRLEDGRVI